jgi:iron complex transport system substrate-binding protein
MPAVRIVSFLPSATEMACALGLAEQLVGVTHECDYPEEIKGKPVVVRSALPVENMSGQEIDRAVSERLQSGQSLYQVDEQLLRELNPDLILTQDLCQVCAPSGNEVTQVLNALRRKPQILSLTPKTLDGIFDNIRQLGAATGRSEQAEALIEDGRAQLDAIAAITRPLAHRPRVFCMEWLEPVYCCGHWVAQMVRIAGGKDELGREGSDSVRIAWADVLRWKPEILVLMPCGFDLKKTMARAQGLSRFSAWEDIPAVRSGRVYAVDANAYFARPGPRVVDGTRLLAHLIHPDRFDWTGPAVAFARLAANVEPASFEARRVAPSASQHG